MITIFIFWAVAAILGGAWGLMNRRPEEKETEGEGVAVDDARLEILRDAFRAIAPNSRGMMSRDLLNLSTLIQKMEAGEELPEGLGAYLLSRIPGAEGYAERLERLA